MDARCRIEMFGGLKVVQGDQVHTRFRTHKAASLLAYLALHLQQAHPRERLLELLWPDLEMEAGRDNLSTTLSQLRRQLEPTGVPSGAVLIADRQQLRLNPDAVSTDVADFDHLIRQARSSEDAANRASLLQRAIDLYRGELLPGYYEDWATPEQTRCQSVYLESLRRLTRLLEEVGQYPEALALAQRAAIADPYAEEACQAQMRLLVRLKRPSVALQLYTELEERFQRELGARPSAATRQMADTLRQDPRAVLLMKAEAQSQVQNVQNVQAAVAAPSSAPPPAAVAHVGSDAAAPSLPLQLTRFFGREPEREQLVELLQTPGIRLVTILGPGGAGKTRLSIEVAGQLAPAFNNRVWFVSLADVPDANLIASALVNTLHLTPDAKTDLLERVAAFLGDAPCLLVLDNLEHLLRETPGAGKNDNPAMSGTAALIRLLLQRVPGLVCLATSRQATRLGGEHEFALPPMGLPTDASAVSPEALLHNESVALYVDRARSVRADFALTSQNAPSIAALCRRLEGMPLAVEMAAAWVKTIPPQKMLERLEQRLDLLVSRRRDLPPRHQSLRATIEWSYDLLAPELRTVFARLSVFRGGWTLEGAEALCGAEALHALLALQEQSLIIAAETEGEMRYRMLEPLREFAHEKLQQSEDAADTLDRYIGYYVEMVKQAHNANHRPEEKTWMDLLSAEHDNLRASLQLALAEDRDAETAVEMVSKLWWYCMMQGHAREGRGWCRLAMARCSTVSLSTRAYLLNGAGNLANDQGDLQEARALLQEAIDCAQRAENQQAALMGRNNLAIVAYDQGDIELARKCWEENLTVARENNWVQGIGSTLSNLGELAYDEGDYARAFPLLEESCLLRERSGDRRYHARSLGLLGKVALRQNELARAESLLRNCLAIRYDLGDQFGVVETAEAIAALAIARENPHRAARLLAFADRARQEAGTPRPPNETREYAECLDAIRHALDATALTTAWQEGELLTAEQVCALVRVEPASVS